MGWFWTDESPAPAKSIAPHPMPSLSDATPPVSISTDDHSCANVSQPGCPMHKATPVTPRQAVVESPPTSQSACPYTPPDSAAAPPKNIATISKLNPLNWMPSNLSNAPATNQNYDLPLERERSSIPKGDGSGHWEYPSPQQMYNALRRKGYDGAPQDGVEPMVAVHNFLNEGTWAEILEWERRFGSGVLAGARRSLRGEAGTVHHAASEEIWDEAEAPVPQLARFMGRPGELSPKARMMQMAAYVFPQRFSRELPFDRHDWFVRRLTKDGAAREVRYVIDYYSGPPEDDGMPVFFLDVRPAVDSPSAAAARLIRWGGDVWYRGTGGEAREQAQARNA